MKAFWQKGVQPNEFYFELSGGSFWFYFFEFPLQFNAVWASGGKTKWKSQQLPGRRQHDSGGSSRRKPTSAPVRQLVGPHHCVWVIGPELPVNQLGSRELRRQQKTSHTQTESIELSRRPVGQLLTETATTTPGNTSLSDSSSCILLIRSVVPVWREKRRNNWKASGSLIWKVFERSNTL